MKSLTEYIKESKSTQESVTVWDGENKEDLIRVFDKFDTYIAANKALYVCSGWWPGTEVECWGDNFDQLLKSGYVRIQDISWVELVNNKLVLYPNTGNKNDQCLNIWILKPEKAKYLDFRGAGEDVNFDSRNASSYSKKRGAQVFGVRDLEPLKSAPEDFKKIFGKSHSGFAKSIGALKNTLSNTELKNILK